MAQITDFTNFATEYPNYFPGQYLLEEDFQLEHKYLSDRLRYQNQSLHISGIVEGLNVELKEDRKSVLIKLGSAIDNQGNLIVLKSDTTFAEFNNINQGELYLEYSENKDVKQQNEVTDSYTRWRENPKLGFADTTPETGIKLAKITISEGNITDINAEIQDFSGLSLPNSNGKALTLRSAGNTNPNLAVLTGSLKLDGDLMVDGNVGIGTTTPSAPLEIQATNQTTPNNNGLYIFNPTNSNNQHAIVSVRVAGSDAGNPFVSWDVAGESGWAMGIDNSDQNKLKIGRNWNSLSANTSMTLDTRGNVGIGIATPGAKLEISGDLKLQSGVAVSNISNDVTLRDNNDLTIATAKAIKTYADTKALLAGSSSQDFAVKNLASETLSFGSSVRQMINLWRTEYGIGIQGSTQYFRTAQNFAWYKGGNHDNNELNPGGGTVQMVIKDGNVGIGKAEPGAKLEVDGDIKVNGRLIGRVGINDTRNVNEKPTDFGKEVSFDFKSRTTVGVPGAGNFSGMLTIAPWGDNSGDASHQLNFNEGGIFWRQGQPGAQAWGGWSKIANNGMTDAFSFGGNLDVQGITNTKNLEVTGALTINGDLKCNNGAVELNVFSDQDEDEWPKITWHRDTSKNWDEGLIKHSSQSGVFKKAGYGVHMNQSREFGIWSSGWNALFAVEGGTGNSYIKGDLQVGAKLEISGDLQLKNGVGVNKISNDVNLKENNNTTIATSKAIKTYADTKALLAGSSSQNFSAKNLSVSGSLSFGQSTKQMINLWKTEYGIGVQTSTQYFRTNSNFAWYKGGSHNNNELNPGGGTVQMVIKNGDVGIGTTSIHNPQGWNKTLDILGTNHARLNVRSNGGVVTSIFSHNDWNGPIGVIGTDSNHSLALATNYTKHVILNTDGNLTVNGEIASRGIKADYNRNTHIDTDGSFYRYDGQVYITVDDNLYIRDYRRDRQFHFDLANRRFNQPSDKKQKKNIQPIENGLQKILNLSGVTFQWKDHKSSGLENTQIGLIAQEVEKVFPEVVETNQDGMKMMNYTGLIAPIIQAMKEQQQQISKLLKQLEKQKTQLKKLNSKLS